MWTGSSSKSLSKSKPLDEAQIVARSAIASRLILLALIIFWRSLCSPYDTSATLNPNCLSSDPNTLPESVKFPSIRSAIEGSIVWDGVYFVRIAQCGYEYEQTYAFLPLLPFCIFVLSRTVFSPLVPLIGYRAVLGLSGYVINNIAFVFAAIYFYKTSLIILKDKRAALQASLLFCFNPASVFYSSLYTESLYSLFSLGGLYHLMSGSNTIAMLLLSISVSGRSNGVLNAGYFCYQAMHKAYDAFFQKKHIGLAVWTLIVGAVRSLCIFVPFIAFQIYGYYNICLERLSDDTSPWCKSRLPFLYDYLQGHYWGVGFLRYFQLKQLPNFLLASPILSLAICSIVHYAKSRPEIVFSLGFRASSKEKNFAAVFYSLATTRKSDSSQSEVFLSKSEDFSSKTVQGDVQYTESLIVQYTESLIASLIEDPVLRWRKQKSKEEALDYSSYPTPSDYEAKTGFSSVLVLPFVLHLGFMAATAFFVMHVQVATRFLSASPPLYWFSSYLMISPGTGRRWGYLIWTYSVAYILLGSLLFSNFYPFT